MLYIEQNIKKKKPQKMVENEINGVVDDENLVDENQDLNIHGSA